LEKHIFLKQKSRDSFIFSRRKSLRGLYVQGAQSAVFPKATLHPGKWGFHALSKELL
jgi:hypothetical protein